MGDKHQHEKELKKASIHRVNNGAGIIVNINFAPLGARLDLAQFALDRQISKDMINLMPFADGNLRQQTATINAVVAGEGKVYKYNPAVEYAHYQYVGKLYVDPVYRKGGFFSPDYGFWSRPKIKKVATDIPLQYKTPHTGDHWDAKAFKLYKNDWVEVVRRALE